MDLRIYSNFSVNGGASLNKILKQAQKQGLKEISITDRNTVLAHLALKSLNVEKYYSGKIRTGVELDVYDNNQHFQVIAYDFDPAPVQNWIVSVYGGSKAQQEKTYHKLTELCKEKGIVLSDTCEWNKNRELAHENILRNIKLSVANKQFFGGKFPKSASEFYKLCTEKPDFPLYFNVDILYPNLSDVTHIIYLHKGKVYLAHPFEYDSSINVKKLLDFCVKAKLTGVEVYTPYVTPEQITYLLDYSNKNGFYVTGGSGFGKYKKVKKMVNLADKISA